MKFTVVFVLVACLQVKATTYAQNVSLNVRNASLSQVLAEIKKQSGYNFFYNDAMVRTGIPVTVDMKSMPVEEALKLALSNQPLSFSIVNKTVVLKDKMTDPGFTTIAPPPADLRGRVADSLGNPLIGATVRVKGHKELAITDGNGFFNLKNVDDNDVLIISFTGYATKEAPVKAKGDGGRMQFFMLQRSSNPLDEVQVIAYGTNTKRFNVGNVSTVNAAEIKASGATNITNALTGRVAGLDVSVSNGVPGTRQPMQMRGQQTLQAKTTAGGIVPFDQPLIIVDGIPLAAQNTDINVMLSGFNNGVSGGPGFSALNGLNPADIESISVLKDADATSIYGSQGANGVIVITTQKGKPGKNRFNVSVLTGPSKNTRNLKMMNTPQYLAIRHQAIISDSILTPPSDPYYFKDLAVYDTTKYTDFAKEYFGGTANNTDAHLSLSGGSTYNTFIVSAGYTRQTYNFPGDFKDQRYSIHSGLSSRSTNNKFKVDFGADLSYGVNNSPGSSSVGRAMMTVPNRPDMLDENGKLVWVYNGVDVSGDQLLGELKKLYNLQSYVMNDYLRLSYQVLPGLNISTNAGYSMNMTKQYNATPTASAPPNNTSGANAGFGRSDNQSINIEPQLDYKKNIGEGVLSVLLGGTYKKVNMSMTRLIGSGYTNDALLGTIAGASAFSAEDDASLYKYVAGFGRINYIWKDKYIVNLTGRRDGSSNFGPKRRFGNFGSVGLGWIISEEKFMESLKPVLSFAKVSGSYGTNGSDGNAPYNYQPYWRVEKPTSSPNFNNTRPYTASNLYNPYYSWASKHSVNLGLDLGFIDDKILLNVALYRNRIGNQLTSYMLPNQTGFSTVIRNMDATLEDKGIEVTITTRNITHDHFTWSTGFNITANRNKLLSFPNIEKTAYNSIYAIGQSTNRIYGFKFAGVNDTTGLFQFYNAKGEITSRPSTVNINNGGDMQPIADVQTDFYGGLSNNFTYKNWGLNLFFKFSKALARNYLYGMSYASNMPGGQQNLPAFMQDMFWTKPGDNKPLQRLTSGARGVGVNGPNASRGASYFVSSDAVYSDNTYLRLKSAALTYALPKDAIKRLGIHGCTLNVTAQNLFTITNYKFGDPEMPGSLYSVPMQLIVTGGFSLEF